MLVAEIFIIFLFHCVDLGAAYTGDASAPISQTQRVLLAAPPALMSGEGTGSSHPILFVHLCVQQ